jgi:aminoacrylate peracid reductase
MTWTPITPTGSAPPLAPYVSGTRAGNAVYVSGTLAMDASGQTVGVADVRAQTRHVIQAIQRVLQAAGGDLKDIAYNQIFLKEKADYAAMNEVYREYFGAAPPARFCIFCELVRPEFLVEIASVAHVDVQPS